LTCKKSENTIQTQTKQKKTNIKHVRGQTNDEINIFSNPIDSIVRPSTSVTPTDGIEKKFQLCKFKKIKTLTNTFDLQHWWTQNGSLQEEY
jgi:hypothetical protein